MVNTVNTWRKILEEEFVHTGDSFNNLIITLTEEELDVEFNDGYGCAEGKQFKAWSDNYVYVSYEYDGSDFVTYVERHPPGYIQDQMEKILLGGSVSTVQNK